MSTSIKAKKTIMTELASMKLLITGLIRNIRTKKAWSAIRNDEDYAVCDAYHRTVRAHEANRFALRHEIGHARDSLLTHIRYLMLATMPTISNVVFIVSIIMSIVTFSLLPLVNIVICTVVLLLINSIVSLVSEYRADMYAAKRTTNIADIHKFTRYIEANTYVKSDALILLGGYLPNNFRVKLVMSAFEANK